jgi:DNA-binding response OmpR family regulator
MDTIPANILVVEDDPIAASAVEAALALIEESIDITIARTSAKALQLLQSKGIQFDLIVLDLDLESQGAGLAVLYKASEIPIIVVTGRTTADLDENITRKVGAANFYSKPIDPEVFSDTARNLMQLMGAFKRIYLLPGGCSYDARRGLITTDTGDRAMMENIRKEIFDLFVQYYPETLPTNVLIDEIYGGFADQKSALYKMIKRLKDTLIRNNIPLSIVSSRGRHSLGYDLVAMIQEE